MSDEESIRNMIAGLPSDESAEVLKRINSRLENLSELASATIAEVKKEKAAQAKAEKYIELDALLKNPRVNVERRKELAKELNQNG